MSEVKPLFSIITVTYNAASTLPPTIASVMEQTCDLYEMIVVDGASTDGTLDLLREYTNANLRWISEPDKGIYDAMNKGIAMAEGEYLIFLNAGDRFASAETLQLLADAAMDDDFPGIIYGQTDIVDSDGRVLGPRHLRAPEVLTLDSFKDGMTVCHQAFVALRKITGFYNLDYRFSADYDWCIRCLQHSRRNHYVDETIIHYLSEGMTTANMKASLRERFNIMCRYFGTMPTMWRHLKFLKRYINRRSSSASPNKQ
ncbi:MAG: glycosyltransferase [Muribaculaceae bacterium]|nr:glycosyltransferase [Muribaculaceae bacterium]